MRYYTNLLENVEVSQADLVERIFTVNVNL
jgi:hypothetical protein